MNFRRRIEAIRKLIAGKGLDGALISSPQNKYYFGGLFSSSGYIVITRENQYLMVDSRYFAEAKTKTDLFQAVLLSAEHTVERRLNSIVAGEGLAAIGFEGKELSYDAGRSLQAGVNCDLASLDLAKLRAVKEPEEIEAIRQACAIADAAFRHILGHIREGMSERAVENELLRFMRAQGGQKESFDSIVASGVRGALPHGKASDKPIRKGELVTLDFGVKYDYYCSDITRTIALGKCPAELSEAYEVVRAAGEAAMRTAIRPREV